MSSNQQEPPPPASSATQCPRSANSEKEKKEIKYPRRTIEVFIGHPGRYDPQVWDFFCRTLVQDPRWISRTGYSPLNQPPPLLRYPPVLFLMCGKFSGDEAEEKTKAALHILTALGFRMSSKTGPRHIHCSMEWDPPSLDRAKKKSLPDVSLLEHIKWEKGEAQVAEVKTKLETEVVDGEEEGQTGNDDVEEKVSEGCEN
ncbi:hypothetical protein B0H65DRAFT_463068 [Neurospora tetraspora]|uniref:Uncharacterized protein n=1 Tax=Neurospora tetraspora TaxID=94610 RepID=A0AAE0JI45_9PEZI|nr:hypothetical protein B0H65DRAFT_463068 [Neurospora tetraspora]